MALCSAIEKSYAKKKIRKYIYEFPIYANFSYKIALKPVGRMDPSRFEKVDKNVNGGLEKP